VQGYPNKSYAKRGTYINTLVNNYLIFSKFKGEIWNSDIVEAYMLQMQITGEPIGEVRAVSNMHQRKAEMARQADAFIALPGNITKSQHP